MAITWNSNYELTPLGQDSPTGADDEIRLLKDSISKRMANEHETFETTNSSGAEGDDFVHKAGSAKVYYQATAPTLRPDGATSLDSEDTGRLWIDSDTNVIYLWSGTEWVETDKLTFSNLVTFNDDIIQAWGKKGCANKPPTTAGGTIIHRDDTVVTLSKFYGDDSYYLAKTLTLPEVFPDSSLVKITFQHKYDESEGCSGEKVYMTVDGSTVFSDTDNTSEGNYYTATLASTTVNGGSVIRVYIGADDGSYTSVNLYVKNLRVSIGESPTDWELGAMGLTG